MFTFDSLEIPLVAAPMAGAGTPALVRAAGGAGAIGFLAAGNTAVPVFAEELREVAADHRPYGVNLFVPDSAPLDDDTVAALSRYRERLAPLADRLGVTPGEALQDDDGYPEKLALVLEQRVPVVSFTFGLPSTSDVEALHEAGSTVAVTVQHEDDARDAVDRGADALVVQGPEAGGHRSTFSTDVEPDARPLPELFSAVRTAVDVPLVASGGLTTGPAIRAALDAGAVAAQVGTAFLLSDEAKTPGPHRRALRDPAYTESRATRAFSGRYARGLVNEYLREFEPLAPAAYPALQRMVTPVRAAATAAGESKNISLWAGAHWREAPEGPAAEIVENLWRDAR